MEIPAPGYEEGRILGSTSSMPNSAICTGFHAGLWGRESGVPSALIVVSTATYVHLNKIIQ